MTDVMQNPALADLPFHKAMLDALTANVALLDKQGTILFVNESWQRFGEANKIHDPRYGVGANYFEACRAAVDPNARAAAKGIQDVLNGQRSSFNLEYPCHSPDEQRWFMLRATPVNGYPGFVVVSHENITERVIAESKPVQGGSSDTADFVARSFPQWRERIEELVTENHEFRNVCTDYQELATWIDENQSTCADPNELDLALELLDSLKEEISHSCSVSDANLNGPR